ncbi:MAG: PTS fructose transporter subunit IIA [Planctomycetota bacterium]|nr:MAG: PTS fructose transporter subunit IIA [Planctomycetota bacterium]
MKLSQNEAAQLLQVSERTIGRWIQQLGLPHKEGEGGPLFERNELIDWANAHSLRLAMDVPGEEDGPLPSLSETLGRGGIHYELGAAQSGQLDVESALEEVAQRLPLPELVDRMFFHQVLLAREDLGSTGIGEGVAIPHVRSPLVLHIDQPVVGLFFLKQPIDWGALDGQAVSVLFTLVSPGVRSHLHLLSRIGFALRDPELSQLLVTQGDRAQIMAKLEALDAKLGGGDH